MKYGGAPAAAASLLAALLAAAVPAAAGPAGEARAVDGDTLEIGGQRIRLFGIDAPEMSQTCAYRGRTVACGRMAAEALAFAVSGRIVSCREESRDRWGRIVATCFVGSGSETVDLGAWLVVNGAAVAETRYSRRYLPHQERAQANRSGIWPSEFLPPREYREAMRGRREED